MLVGLHSVSGPKWCQLRMLKLLYIISLSYRDALFKKTFFKGQVGLWLGLDSEAAKTTCLHTLISFPCFIALPVLVTVLWPPLVCASWCPLFRLGIQDGSPTGLTDERNTIIGFKQATGIHWFLFFFFMFSKFLSPYRKGFYAQISYFYHVVI